MHEIKIHQQYRIHSKGAHLRGALRFSDPPRHSASDIAEDPSGRISAFGRSENFFFVFVTLRSDIIDVDATFSSEMR